ncbi:MAG: DUF5011 domain-containing protein [Ruminococcaceae bacterium]|nr:DUF5011 domain-containing protein [Oscillospiraceae bacterium]
MEDVRLLQKETDETAMKKAIFIISLCVLALMVVTVGVTAFRGLDFGNAITLTLNGAQNMSIEVGETYQEAGASAVLSDTEVPVTVSGSVDSAHIGDYLIKYTAQANGYLRTEYRYVRVVDSEAPVITLTTDPNAYTLIGETYVEEGFKATDNYDGDLTQEVVRKEKDGIMTYTVTDSYGNVTSVTRKINYVDPNAPILTLEGGQLSFIMVGDNYEEPGCTATDFRDGDLSANVIVSGDVDGNIPGIYTLQYSITNSIGVAATKERTIYVIPKQEEASSPDAPSTENPENPDDPNMPPIINLPTPGTTIEPNGKTIYLTFDDGPGPHTDRLLDILKKYGVKASFFIKGANAHPQCLTRAAEEGHTVAIHTYSHNYSEIYASDESFLADLEATQNVILQHTGQKAMLTRFPGGSSNTVSSAYNKGIMTRLTKKLEELGYQYFDWNVDSNDAGGAKDADEVFKNVTEGVAKRTNSVVLQHDTREFSVDAVERIIAWGLCNGYTFAALDFNSPTCHHGIWN